MYTLNGQVLTSVSQIVASQFKPFNAPIMASILANTKAGNPESPYYGMDKYQIQNKWAVASREARELGTKLHQEIECFYKHDTVPEIQTSEFKQFLKFADDHPDWVLVASEHRVHNDQVAGTIDAVFNTPEGWILVDWKRARSIDYAGPNQGRECMKHVADCNYSKYSLQLSLYRHLIDVDITKAFIIQMHPDIEGYRKIVAVDFHTEAKLLLKMKRF
jgi:ATP-dependent exoDNAse (exonuclease V) beta subunit